MAHLSSTFSDPSPGKLEVTLEGVFHQGGIRRDAGFPGSDGGAGNLLVRSFVGPVGETRRYSQPIDRYAPTAVMSMDYPGGSVVWPAGTEEVSHVDPTSGLWAYGFHDLKMKIVLIKR